MTTILLPIRRGPTVAEGDELQALLDDMVEIPLWARLQLASQLRHGNSRNWCWCPRDAA